MSDLAIKRLELLQLCREAGFFWGGDAGKDLQAASFDSEVELAKLAELIIARTVEKMTDESGNLRDRGVAPTQPINLAGLPFELTKEELDGFYRFCESVSSVHGHGISDAMLQRLTVIGLVRQRLGNEFEVTEFGVALNQSRLPLPAMDWAVDPADPHRKETERKTVGIIKRGYRISGFVLRSGDHEHVCVSEYGAFRWLDSNEMFSLLHNGPKTHLTSVEQQLALVRDAVLGYYEDLEKRKHGGIAQHEAFNRIESAIGLYWQQGLSTSPKAATVGDK